MIYRMASDDLGTRIRRAREAKGWSQQDLAGKMPKRPDGRGTGVRSVGRWERGETVPRSALGALEVVLSPYFTVNGTAPPAPADPRERELFDLLTAENAPAQDRLTPAEAWEVIEEYRRRAQRRTA
jgi:transcriptional regulator with XRE-family HTH domain